MVRRFAKKQSQVHHPLMGVWSLISRGYIWLLGSHIVTNLLLNLKKKKRVTKRKHKKRKKC